MRMRYCSSRKQPCDYQILYTILATLRVLPVAPSCCPAAYCTKLRREDLMMLVWLNAMTNGRVRVG